MLRFYFGESSFSLFSSINKNKIKNKVFDIVAGVCVVKLNDVGCKAVGREETSIRLTLELLYRLFISVVSLVYLRRVL